MSRARNLTWSSLVAGGALIQTPVLDLSDLSHLEVLVDNTLGTALRDLSLASFLPDGATLVDTFLLRRCGFGLAANGAQHDPGRVRGLVSPHPPAPTSGVYTLFDQGVGAVATGPLVVEDIDAVDVMQLGGGPLAWTANEVLDDGTIELRAGGNTVAGGNPQPLLGWGLGTGTPQAPAYPSNQPEALPRRISFTVAVGGTRFWVKGRGRTPGSFSHAMVLPPWAQITLAAGGAGAARLSIFARSL